MLDPPPPDFFPVKAMIYIARVFIAYYNIYLLYYLMYSRSLRYRMMEGSSKIHTFCLNILYQECH